MADDWFYAQKQERNGPVPFTKLQSLAKAGWLTPDDLVWGPGMSAWTPAREVEGLFDSTLAAGLRKTIDRTIDGLGKPAKQVDANAAERKTPPGIPEKQAEPAPAPKPTRPKRRELDWNEIRPRHVLAACGSLLATLGVAFTVIAASSLSLAFTLGGLFLVACGLYVEIGAALREAITNIARASKESAERRLRAKELALEKQRLDLEAAKLAQDQAARQAPVGAPPAIRQRADRTQQIAQDRPASSGQVVVINQPPMRRWSPGLAAVLSFLLPGLGQLYKGQIINGVMWFLCVGLGYAALIVPGLILHFCCVLGALSGNPWTEGRTTVVREET